MFAVQASVVLFRQLPKESVDRRPQADLQGRQGRPGADEERHGDADGNVGACTEGRRRSVQRHGEVHEQNLIAGFIISQ